MYGKELLLDLHNCDVSKFNREDLDLFFIQLCKEIDMVQCERFFWDDVGVPEEKKQTAEHTKGTSAVQKIKSSGGVQFILTSNITIHTLELTGAAYINIHSCKDFKPADAELYCRNFFNGEVVSSTMVDRL